MPGLKNKRVFQSMTNVWDSAVRMLTTATRIVILGFSFPPPDVHFKYLLAAGLQNNISLRQIVFACADEAIVPRVTSLFRADLGGVISPQWAGRTVVQVIENQEFMSSIGRDLDPRWSFST
jgi:hypothetical protein